MKPFVNYTRIEFRCTRQWYVSMMHRTPMHSAHLVSRGLSAHYFQRKFPKCVSYVTDWAGFFFTFFVA